MALDHTGDMLHTQGSDDARRNHRDRQAGAEAEHEGRFGQTSCFLGGGDCVKSQPPLGSPSACPADPAATSGRVGSGRVGLVHARRQSCASAFMVSIAKLPIPHRHAGRSDARLHTTATQEPDVLPLSDAGAGTHASPTAAGGRVDTGLQATGGCRHQGWLGSVPMRRAPSSCVPFRPPFASSCKRGSAPPSWPHTAPCRLPGSTPSAAPW